ncbi:unnamed protein product [Rodentolepis nana]|uniref:CULLIN_2 domain-containing protein n=1 Tax=Rodentolepis nana TaxID=102285 RepID=A0A0R3TKK7_RODNA|nr:unnamed protein product [Rodentolepis nana]
MAVNQVLKEILSSPKNFSFDKFDEQDVVVFTEPDNDRSFEENHLKLREAVLAVFNAEKVDESLEALYRLLVRNIFLQLDQQILEDDPDFHTIWDLGLALFRKLVAMHDNIHTIYAIKIVEMISAERSGNTIEKSILKSLTSMFTELNLYIAYLEPRFIGETERFYDLEGFERTAEMNISSYVQYVKRRIKEEEDLVTMYLNRSTRKSLTIVLNDALITKQMPFLFSSLQSLVTDENWHDLNLLYSLLSRVSNGVERLREEFKKTILAAGLEIVQNSGNLSEKDRELIPRLLKFRDALNVCVKESFQCDASCNRIVNDAFEEFINRRPNKPAELLAKYIDLNLRGNKRSQFGEDFDKEIDNLMILFRYINGKDVFKAYYENLLCKRLICGRSASVDAEKAVLSRLKDECGPEYTRAMDQMFRDVEASEDLSEKFQRSRPDTYSIDFTICILAPSACSQMPKEVPIYPNEMISIKNDFDEYYLSQRKGKKLTYIPYFGSCIVKAHFPETPKLPKELQVSEYQALILLLFNDVEDEGISYARIAEATGIPKHDLDRALISFTATKSQRVLISKPLTTDLKDDTMFYFNKRFTHSLTRIRFNQIQLKETKKEHDATEASIVMDRAAHVDCMIVRIMKTRKTIEHVQLIGEVMRQLKFPYKPVDIKKRIEILIGRDFISRDSTFTNKYHYVA